MGLQIVARKHEEEKVWAMAKIVDAALKTRGREITNYGHDKNRFIGVESATKGARKVVNVI